MLDIRLIRTDTEAVKIALAKRNENGTKIEEILTLDEERRKRLSELETIKAEQNRLGPEIAKTMKSGGDASELMRRSTALKADFREREEYVRVLDAEQERQLSQLPNLPLDDVQAGGEADAFEIAPPSRNLPTFDFTPKPHWEICTDLKLVDFERGVKLSGGGFVLYTGTGARLLRGLTALMLDLHTTVHGYTEMAIPYMLTRESVTASGHIVKFAPEMYRDDQEDMFFLPTAEPGLVNLHRGEILDPNILPLKYTAHTPCWRREAGAAGRDTRGLLRVHQFDKVELFRYVEPTESENALQEMTTEACKVLDLLEIPYRLLRLAAGDISFAAAKTIDIEAWAPGADRWLEVSSASNCTDFQARRAGIRYRPAVGAKPEYPHLLNASGLALPRVIAALLETHQQADGSIIIPTALRVYLGGLEKIAA